jgi:multimeric flavodoxin WrbA
MANKTALVIGTSRRNGNTWKVMLAANAKLGLPVFDLADLKISYFDYDARNLNDDFIPTMEKLIEFDTIGLVSPVYWYSVSAQMKTFIDRLSDLLGSRKDLGRKLRGKSLFLMANGSTDQSIPASMEGMVRLTAEYLGMKYLGSHYSLISQESDLSPDLLDQAALFLEHVSAGTLAPVNPQRDPQ